MSDVCGRNNASITHAILSTHCCKSLLECTGKLHPLHQSRRYRWSMGWDQAAPCLRWQCEVRQAVTTHRLVLELRSGEQKRLQKWQRSTRGRTASFFVRVSEKNWIQHCVCGYSQSVDNFFCLFLLSLVLLAQACWFD